MILLSLLKLIGGPGSIGFLVCVTLFGAAVIRWLPRYRLAARAWLVMLGLGYVLLAIPAIAGAIAAPFDDASAGRRPVASAIDVLIVFDGDNRVGRVEEAVRLWSVAHPAAVLASGEQWLLDHLSERGIPTAQLIHDRQSATTREQVQYVKGYLTAHPGARVALVASRLQMPRVVALSRRDGARVMFYAALVDREPASGGVLLYVPTYAALLVSRDALYERVALAYYRWKGWIDPEPLAARS